MAANQIQLIPESDAVPETGGRIVMLRKILAFEQCMNVVFHAKGFQTVCSDLEPVTENGIIAVGLVVAHEKIAHFPPGKEDRCKSLFSWSIP